MESQKARRAAAGAIFVFGAAMELGGIVLSLSVSKHGTSVALQQKNTIIYDSAALAGTTMAIYGAAIGLRSEIDERAERLRTLSAQQTDSLMSVHSNGNNVGVSASTQLLRHEKERDTQALSA